MYLFGINIKLSIFSTPMAVTPVERQTEAAGVALVTMDELFAPTIALPAVRATREREVATDCCLAHFL